MDADTSNQQQLTDTQAYEHDPKWAPGGGKIVFVRDGDLYTMSSADGSNQRNITKTPGIGEGALDWYAKP